MTRWCNPLIFSPSPSKYSPVIASHTAVSFCHQTATLLGAMANAVLLMKLLKCQGQNIGAAQSSQLGHSGHWLWFGWLDAFALTNARCARREIVASHFLSVWIYPAAAHKSGYILAHLVQQRLLPSMRVSAEAYQWKQLFYSNEIMLLCTFHFIVSAFIIPPADYPWLPYIKQIWTNMSLICSRLRWWKGLVKCGFLCLPCPRSTAEQDLLFDKRAWACQGPNECLSPLTSVSTLVRPPEHSFGGRRALLLPTWAATSSFLHYA